MRDMSLIELVEESAIAREDSPVPRDYIVEALEMIENGELDIETYPSGLPSLKAVYRVAKNLYNQRNK